MARNSCIVWNLLDSFISVRVTYPNICIYVDDAFVGKSPITLNLKLGHHYVRMFVKDYRNWSEQFTIVTGPELLLTAVLEKSN